MNPDDAEQLMNPFFPHDPFLAIQSLSNTLFETDGCRLPNWIWEAVVQQYFTHLMIKKQILKYKHMCDQLNAEDPLKMQTIPYMLFESPTLN